MASVWFTVIVLSLVQIDFAYCCKESSAIRTCDECIRCSGQWCSQSGVDEHCTLLLSDDFCSGAPEQLPSIDHVDNPGDIITPKYAERTLYIENANRLDITYQSPVMKKVTPIIYNSTQTNNIDITLEGGKCDGTHCTITIVAMAHSGFCSELGTTFEYVYANLKFGDLSEEAVIKYHVACACECSKKMERKSDMCSRNGDFACGACNCYKGWQGERCDEEDCRKKVVRMSSECKGHGDYMCGACNCHNGWEGEFCDELVCGEKRGDVQCTNPARNDVECSGNGYCSPCEICTCYTDREGSQYFDPENFCSDICMLTSECDTCFINGTLGPCPKCELHNWQNTATVTILERNQTRVEERDVYNRKIWTGCNETVETLEGNKCYVEYVAMRNETGVYVMVLKSCNDRESGEVIVIIGNNVPIILGVLGLIATVAVVGGIVLWRHLNAVPPLPLTDPQYQNIDAEDCTGENPLYKPPTSSFKNPTYGKW